LFFWAQLLCGSLDQVVDLPAMEKLAAAVTRLSLQVRAVQAPRHASALPLLPLDAAGVSQRGALEEHAVDAAVDLQAQEQALFEDMRKLVEHEEVAKAAKDRLVDYLTFHAYALPMYMRPGLAAS
jgi:hypothetical protein